MQELRRGYGTVLVSVFFGAVVLWALALIILPQFTMLDRALTLPKRQLDSSIAQSLSADAASCAFILKRDLEAEQAAEAEAGSGAGSGGGLAIPSPKTAAPSPSTMAVPSPSTTTAPSPSDMGIPSPNTTAGSAAGPAVRGYIAQCARSTTHTQLVRDDDAPDEFLDEVYGLPLIAVDPADPLEVQIATAEEVQLIAEDLFRALVQSEAEGFQWTLRNFEVLPAAREIPLSDAQREIEDALLSNQAYGMIGLRFELEGATYQRIGLITLTRTLFYAVAATLLALILCYPIAYKLALATPAEKAIWLFLGLVIPYAIAELMRIYAWTAIIDNFGVINTALDWIRAQTGLGSVNLAEGEFVEFKRSPITVFVVIVYTYILFMVFPIYNVMSTLDRNQVEAARDLGASTWRVHSRVIIPYSKPGIAVGCIATFMLTAGAFSVPRIISSGLQAEWFTQTIYNKFFESDNSNVGAAYAFSYTFLCFVIVGLFMWLMRTRLKDFVRT